MDIAAVDELHTRREILRPFNPCNLPAVCLGAEVRPQYHYLITDVSIRAPCCSKEMYNNSPS